MKPLLAALLACVAIAVLFVTGIAAQRFGNREPAAAAVTAPVKASPTHSRSPGIGDAVRDGKFEFVVSGVDCSRTTVGLEHLKRTAKGKYCIVSLSVRNIADGSQYFLGHAQKAYDAAGTAYGNDELAGVYANRDTQTFLQKLTRGERTSGKLVFDVPAQVKLVRLKLHDSLLSGGVDVTL
ncbi:DUF4352 domain-containing protein [Actinoplanes sp. NPDC026619]|uniref:DUF4352 domain-containing protein n=1 Tax=Actinoplanes sp. NPDC026619 TaxID=3155798 RepID=UPI0033E4E12F